MGHCRGSRDAPVPYPAARHLGTGMYKFLFRCGALWGVGGVRCGIFDIGLLAHDTPLSYLFLLISVTPA